MNTGNQMLAVQLLKATAAIIVGAVAITSVHLSINTNNNPYYAVIATQRVAQQQELEKFLLKAQNDANDSRTSSK